MPLHRHHRFRQLPRSIKSKLQQPIRSTAITRGRADLIETRPLKQAARTRRSRHRKEEKDPSLHLLGINVYGQLPHTGIRPDKNDQRGSTAKKLRYPVLLPGTNQRSGATLPHTTHHEGAAYLEKNLTACVVRYFLFRVVAFFSRTSLVPLNSKSGTTTTSRDPQRPYENEHTIAYNRNWKHRLCCDPCLARVSKQIRWSYSVLRSFACLARVVLVRGMPTNKKNFHKIYGTAVVTSAHSSEEKPARKSAKQIKRKTEFSFALVVIFRSR